MRHAVLPLDCVTYVPFEWLGMHLPGTVLFVDLVGSTALFEAWGNSRATQEITQLTQQMGDVVQAHGGRVVKKLGDGLLVFFADASAAVSAAGTLQSQHLQGSTPWPFQQGVGVRVGVASGNLVQVDGDIYGDAVNVAARLCERAGIGEIWVTDTTAVDAGALSGIRFRALGDFDIRGKSEPLTIYLAEWHSDKAPEALTQQASFSAMAPLGARDDRCIQLSWQGQCYQFSPTDLPLHVGRSAEADICIDDARVSRLQIRLDWRSGRCMLTDLSSYGTWLRFDGSATEMRLHRDSCVLHGKGRMALGMRWTEQAPMLGFSVGEPSQSPSDTL